MNTEAFQELEPILATAFAVPDGQAELDCLVRPATGINILRDIGTIRTPMKTMIHLLCEEVGTRGDEASLTFVRALYVGLPGDEALRLWVIRHLPGEAALVPDELFEQERDAYAASRQAGWKEAAITGFGVLHAERTQSRVSAEIAAFQDKLRLARSKLQLLDCYKKLHDNLHNIQTQPLSRFVEFTLERDLDELALVEIDRQIDVLSTYIPLARASIRLLPPSPERTEEESWLPELQAGIASLRTQKPETPEALRLATLELGGVLRIHMARLNRLLVSAARAIPFAQLAELLRRAARAAADGQDDGESPATRSLSDAAAAVDAICARLIRTIAVHDGWQTVETALWAMESLVRSVNQGSRPELASFWKLTKPRIEALRRADPGEWAAQLDLNAARFERELGAENVDPIALARAFNSYASRARSRFFLVDLMLLDECGAIVDLQPTLESLTGSGK